MRIFALASIVMWLLLSGCASSPQPAADPIAAALAQPGRSAADHERDLRDHPEAVLKAAGFGPGMVIADIFGGGGYYSEILAHVVGPNGRVRLINNMPYHDYAKVESTSRLADQRLPNVSYEIASPHDLKLGNASLDGALIILSYHDLYWVDESGGWPAIDAAQFIDQIVAALKPGASLLIVDHSALAGSGKSAAQSLHRIDEAFAAADFQAHGLQSLTTLDQLRNPADARTISVMDPAIRGQTDRFVHVYRKAN